MKSFYIIMLSLFLSYTNIGYCQTAKDFNDRGAQKFNNGNNSGAISDFSKSIELNPRDADVYYNRGLAKAKLSDYRGALYDYQKALDINPKCTFIYSHRGFSKYYLKDYTGAILDFTKAIDNDPTDHGSYNLRGLAKVRLNDYNGAISDYTKAIEIRPNFAVNYIARGDVKFKIKNYTEAISDFSRVIEIDPNSVIAPIAFYKRGLSKIELGQKESGCSDLNKAAELGYTEANEAINKYCTNLPEQQQIGSEKVSYTEFSNRIKAKNPEYKDMDDLTLAKKMVEKYPYYKDKVTFDQPDKSQIRRYKVGKKIYGIPESKVKAFLLDMPNAVEIQSYILGKDTLDIPIEEVPEFLKVVTNAQPLITYDEGISSKYTELQDMGYDSFKKEVLPSKGNNETFQQKEINSNLKLYNHLIDSKRILIDDLGDFDSFNEILSDRAKAIQFHKKLIKKGFTEDEIGNQAEFLANINQRSSTIFQQAPYFQNDKIKVGNTFIDLPFPSGFVKIDDSMGNLLETAKKLCPETNTLLAYYISEEDYANYLIDENHICEKYILIEVYNELKDIKVGAKDYRQFLKKHKEDYVDEFKLKIDDAEIKASENLSKIDERLKMKDFNIEPFGICYESKYSLSYGILTKYNFTVDYENSEDYIVAGISTITKIDKKPIFLFLYKTYNGSEDIQSLKALNTFWIKEIDKRQGPGSFLAEIDFEDYKESILAILTLSFIWAIYFATKRIHRKIKKRSVNKVAKVEEENEFLDFKELLHEDVKINDELAVEKKAIDSQIKPESPKVSFKTSNPEYLKVNRRTRFYNWLIDAILFYFIIYLPLFLYNAIINIYLYLLILFLYYFLQELLFRKTVGKFVTKTYVVNNLGLKPTVLQLILRNASRLIPFEAFTYFSKEKRGLHDIFSKTYVIKD